MPMNRRLNLHAATLLVVVGPLTAQAYQTISLQDMCTGEEGNQSVSASSVDELDIALCQMSPL